MLFWTAHNAILDCTQCYFGLHTMLFCLKVVLSIYCAVATTIYFYIIDSFCVPKILFRYILYIIFYLILNDQILF